MRVVSSEPVRLTELTSCGGCAAKWGASLLSELVAAASIAGDADLLVGLAPSDDAAVAVLAMNWNRRAPVRVIVKITLKGEPC
ncbi:MAG: hypothetical protein ACRDZS_06390, partial [Acidimicrobiales bacterium]